jgi:hypothetical protein
MARFAAEGVLRIEAVHQAQLESFCGAEEPRVEHQVEAARAADQAREALGEPVEGMELRLLRASHLRTARRLVAHQCSAAPRRRQRATGLAETPPDATSVRGVFEGFVDEPRRDRARRREEPTA